jgi:hypothetical protein
MNIMSIVHFQLILLIKFEKYILLKVAVLLFLFEFVSNFKCIMS